jgi:hypothetical protein
MLSELADRCSYIPLYSSMPSIPNDEQIRALLQGKALDLVRRLNAGRASTGNEYAQVFTVTREEVIEFVKQQGFPKGSYYDRPTVNEGPYLTEEEGLYVVYYKERGVRCGESKHNSKSEALPVMVDLLLGLSGTGLYGRG